MAEPSRPSGRPSGAGPRPAGAGSGFLTKKSGPLPNWAWGAILVGTFYLYYRYKQSKSASATSSVGSIPISGPQGMPYGGYGSVGYGGSSGGSSLPPIQSPTPTPVTTPAPSSQTPSAQSTAAYLGQAGMGNSLTTQQAGALSELYQPQNQPGSNPNVSSTPTTQLQAGSSLPAASGTGTRYVTPGPQPYAFTYG